MLEQEQTIDAAHALSCEQIDCGYTLLVERFHENAPSHGGAAPSKRDCKGITVLTIVLNS